MTTPHIDQLRQHLIAALGALSRKDDPMDPDRARALAQVGGVLVDTARVEIEFLKVTGRDHSGFLMAPATETVQPPAGLPNGITSITRHRLEG